MTQKESTNLVRNVLVVNDEHLLGAAVKSVLGKAKEIALFGFTVGCLADLFDLLRTVNFDVLILDSSLYWATTLHSTFACSQEMSGVSVIVVDVSRNLVQVNCIKGLPLRTSYDLVNIIRTIEPILGQEFSAIPTRISAGRINKTRTIRHRRPSAKQISVSQVVHRS